MFPTVSRSIGGLEKALGQDLFSRNSRPLQLTQVGERARSHIVPLLQMHNEMISDLQQGSSQLSGKIRLSLAPGFVTRFMMPMLMEFNVMYPDISFEVGGGGAIQDILQYRSDIAVVTYKPKDARIVRFLPRKKRLRPGCLTGIYQKVRHAAASERFGKSPCFALFGNR